MATIYDGQWVRKERQALGVSQGDLAVWVGCKADALIRFEDGRYRPTAAMLRELQFCLFNLEQLHDLGVGFEDHHRITRLLDWMRGGRLPEEREQAAKEMAAADESTSVPRGTEVQGKAASETVRLQ
jgi:transcriptional regulator with XRE-family HTH domain